MDEERPVRVNRENRPPGDPGGDVDVQEHVGGQRGRADPGATGGPTHADLGAADEADEHDGKASPPGLRRYRRSPDG